MRILVTGAAGLVGRALVPALREKGHEVVIAPGRPQGGLEALRPGMFEGVEHVFHLAARTFVPGAWADPAPYYTDNVAGTVRILDCCRHWRASLTLLSSYVYGHPEYLPIDEDHPVRAFNPYGQSKIMAEEAARFFAQQPGLSFPLMIIRPFNLYGPGQSDQFLIPELIAKARGASVISVKDLRPKRDHLFVDDLVDLLLRSLGHSGTYNAASGSSVSIAELVELINGLLGQEKEIRSENQPRPNDVLDIRGSWEKAARDFGWHPSTTLRRGLARMMNLQES